ncbi:MAG TPA: hypothetical protein VF625_12550 [Longimicrobium sp.]|jgi:hypothetical protein
MRKLDLILPFGTQVVVRREVGTGAGTPLAPAGAVGRIVSAPADGTHAYRVRMVDGAELSLTCSEIVIRKHLQAEALEVPARSDGERCSPPQTAG